MKNYFGHIGKVFVAFAAWALAVQSGCNDFDKTIAVDGIDKEQTEEESKTDDAAAVESEKTVSPAEIPSDIQKVFDAADMISDTADEEYHRALDNARLDRSNAKVLRQLYSEAPDNAHLLRRRMVHFLGEIGNDDDIEMIEKVAIEGGPITAASKGVFDGEDHQLRWMSVAALSRMLRRDVDGAMDSLGRVIRSGDKPFAIAAAIELFAQGKLSKDHVALLDSRGLPSSFKKESLESIAGRPLEGYSDPATDSMTPPSASMK